MWYLNPCIKSLISTWLIFHLNYQISHGAFGFAGHGTLFRLEAPWQLDDMQATLPRVLGHVHCILMVYARELVRGANLTPFELTDRYKCHDFSYHSRTSSFNSARLV